MFSSLGWKEKNICGLETRNAGVLVFLENQLDQQGNILVSMVIFFSIGLNFKFNDNIKGFLKEMKQWISSVNDRKFKLGLMNSKVQL